ncbi:hypothetical protein ACOJBM_17885 [Rhizobium beringeri]
MSSRPWRRLRNSTCSRHRWRREPAPGGKSISVPPGDSDRNRIIDALGPTPVEIDDVIRHTGLSASAVYLILLELDIAGRLHRQQGGLVSLSD